MIAIKNILKINAISSGITGLALVLFAEFFAELFAINTATPFIEVGIFLIGFAVFVFLVGSQKEVNPQQVKVIVWLDSAWVIGSVIAVLYLQNTLSTIGLWLIAGVAVWVMVMAFLQSRGLHKIKSASSY